MTNNSPKICLVLTKILGQIQKKVIDGYEEDKRQPKIILVLHLCECPRKIIEPKVVLYT